MQVDGTADSNFPVDYLLNIFEKPDTHGHMTHQGWMEV